MKVEIKDGKLIGAGERQAGDCWIKRLYQERIKEEGK